MQGCTNLRCQVIRGTKFCMVPPNIFGTLVWIFFHDTFFAPRFFEMARRFLENLYIVAVTNVRGVHL